MTLASRVILWVSLSVGVAVAPFLWRPLTGTGRWTEEIYRGEMILVSIGILGSALGYAAMTKPFLPRLETVKSLIAGPGTLLLILVVGAYVYVHQRTGAPDPNDRPSVHQVSWTSYAIFAASTAAGFGATYLSHRDDQVRSDS